MGEQWEGAPLRRRSVVLAGAAASAAGLAGMGRHASAQSPAPNRVALLIGNRAYPDGNDLPSMHTNVRKLQASLEQLGFRCTVHLDASRAVAVQAVADFGRDLKAKPADTVSLFYFCGHGMQIDAENFLLPSHVFPRTRPLSESRTVNVELGRDVREEIPKVPSGLSIAVVDACRTSFRGMRPEDGLNQVTAKAGELVVFSTGAGKPALAPIDENRLTFFTEALVTRLEASAARPQELTFPELFRLVAADTERTMKNHPVEDIRALAQVPFIADNSGQVIRVSLKPPAPPPDDPARLREESEALEALRQMLWPRDVQRAAGEFLKKFAQSNSSAAVEVASAGASKGAQVLANPDITLQRRDFQLRPDLGDRYNEDLRRASRGDKDAAARIAERIKPGGFTGPAATAYEGWMQFAAELGNGIAAYELARFYSAANRPALVGRWTGRARELGYTPPPGLRMPR